MYTISLFCNLLVFFFQTFNLSVWDKTFSAYFSQNTHVTKFGSSTLTKINPDQRLMYLCTHPSTHKNQTNPVCIKKWPTLLFWRFTQSGIEIWILHQHLLSFLTFLQLWLQSQYHPLKILYRGLKELFLFLKWCHQFLSKCKHLFYCSACDETPTETIKFITGLNKQLYDL